MTDPALSSATAAAEPPQSPSAPRKAPTRKSRRQRRLENLVWQIALIVSLLVLWEYAAGRWVPMLLVSKPSVIGRTMWQWSIDGTYLTNLWVTIEAMLWGFFAGASAGILFGYITGSLPRLGEILQPIVTAFYTLPRLALAPLFLLWFGLGIQFRIVFAASIVFFLVYYNTYYGVREVSSELVAAVRIMGANRFQLARRVILPSALVWVTAGLKISVPYALVGVVVAEMLAANEGMGFLLSTSANQFSASGTFAAIAGLLVIALVIDGILTLLTRRALRWKSAGKNEA